MLAYHGTSTSEATKIAGGGIDVTLGGGELGQGFYTGEYLHEARTWAFHKHPVGQARVVELDVDDGDVVNMKLMILEGRQATAHRNNIRSAGATRTHTFSVDMVWSPIVGRDNIHCDQHKWESGAAGTFLNGSKVTRVVRK